MFQHPKKSDPASSYQPPPLACPFCQAQIAPYHLKCRACGRELPLERPRQGPWDNWGLGNAWRVTEYADGSARLALRAVQRNRVRALAIIGALCWAAETGLRLTGLPSSTPMNLAHTLPYALSGLVLVGSGLAMTAVRVEWLMSPGELTRTCRLAGKTWKRTVRYGEFHIERYQASGWDWIFNRRGRFLLRWRLLVTGDSGTLVLLDEEADLEVVRSFARYLSWKTGFPMRNNGDHVL